MKNFFMSCLFSKFCRVFAVKPVIPEEIYAVPGRECSVYFFNMAPNGFPGDIEVTTPYGRQDEKHWCFTPSKEDAGKSFPLQIEWKAPDGTVLAVCKSIVKVADLVKPKEITILLLGDSLIECSRFPKFLRQQLLDDGYKVKFIGSHIDNGLPACKTDDLPHEGIGGWSFADFASRWVESDHYKTGKSHLLSGEGKFDFQAYLDRYNNGAFPDFILISLGANDIVMALDCDIKKVLKQTSDYMDILVNGIRKAAPDAKIGFCLPYPGGSQDAFGNNYGTKIRRAQYHRNLPKLWQMIMKKCRKDKNAAKMKVVPLNVSFDTEHHLPSANQPASEGSSVNVCRQTNALHADVNGHWQISSILYFWLRNNI